MNTEFRAVPAPAAMRQGGCSGQYSALMLAIRKWVFEHCCRGRMMKTPVPRGKDYDVRWEEPRCFGGDFYPPHLGTRRNPYSIAPSILIFRTDFAPRIDTQEYLHSRNKVSRPKELASSLTLNLVHTIYEPGEREAQADGAPQDVFRVSEEIDTGSLILGDWMDDTCTALISSDALEGTGMTVDPDSVHARPLIENESVSDRRPIYMGVVEATLIGLTRQTRNEAVSSILD